MAILPNIANFVLVVPFKIKKTNKVCDPERESFLQSNISNFTLTNILRNIEENCKYMGIQS